MSNIKLYLYIYTHLYVGHWRAWFIALKGLLSFIRWQWIKWLCASNTCLSVMNPQLISSWLSSCLFSKASFSSVLWFHSQQLLTGARKKELMNHWTHPLYSFLGDIMGNGWHTEPVSVRFYRFIAEEISVQHTTHSASQRAKAETDSFWWEQFETLSQVAFASFTLQDNIIKSSVTSWLSAEEAAQISRCCSSAGHCCSDSSWQASCTYSNITVFV